MALSPISRSPVFSPSIPSTTGTESVSSCQGKGVSALQSSQQSNPLEQLFQADGFDSPLSATKAGGVAEMDQLLNQVAQQLVTLCKDLLGGLNGDATGDSLSIPGGEVPEIGGVDSGAPGLQSLLQGAPQASAAPSAPVAPSAPAAPSAQVSKPEGASSAGGPSSSKQGNTMTFTNDGKSPMTIKFTPNAGDKEVAPVTLQPGKSQTVEFPQGWSGNFRSTSGDGAAATLGEVKFNGGGNQTYYDVSYIEGDNAAMTIKPQSGGKLSGTMDNLLASAPDSVKARNADGSVYGIKKTTTSNVQDPGVVDFYRKHVGADQGYVIPTDDLSTLGTSDTHLDVHLRDLA
ncbi:hypothetical protein JRI60_23305 [Archangium violaceum]|uniref:hypothetical protein n=1 Tax=Archangium violaceum TaxID=83451 RepID=UPI0019514DC5|nr:hypothetical protein [Archangium violaceum]QRO01741.1 hypothetical protein JRI60_23305 [Archangium violaceum]